jgi:CheY-like chemotaxis protein
VTEAGAGLRIFLVEDHPDTMEYFTLYLESLGHTVEHTDTIAEALQRIPLSGCDVLISDVGLKDGTGWDLMSRLRDSGQPYPRYAIAMSGFGRDADRRRSIAAGFRHHVVKPFDPDRLESLLAEAGRDRAT